jgi:hypothetical protein
MTQKEVLVMFRKRRRALTADEGPAPADVCIWPHRRHSFQRWAFQKALNGISRDVFLAIAKGCGITEHAAIRHLRNGRAGGRVLTHEWALDETNGELRIRDVKFSGTVREKNKMLTQPRTNRASGSRRAHRAGPGSLKNV